MTPKAEYGSIDGEAKHRWQYTMTRNLPKANFLRPERAGYCRQHLQAELMKLDALIVHNMAALVIERDYRISKNQLH